MPALRNLRLRGAVIGTLQYYVSEEEEHRCRGLAVGRAIDATHLPCGCPGTGCKLSWNVLDRFDMSGRKDSSIACQKQRTGGVGRVDILSRQARGSVAGAGIRCFLHPDRVIRYRARNSIAAAVQVTFGSHPEIHQENR